MIVQLLLLIVGLAVLVKGADWLINGASAVAKQFNVSNLVIGLTIVSLGTSAPELVVNTYAAYQDHQDLVFGNVIGSNIVNLFAVLGITGIIAPLTVQSSTIWKEIPISLAAVVVLFLIANDFGFADRNRVTRIEGIVLLILFLFFLYYVYKHLQVHPEEMDEPVTEPAKVSSWLLIVAGLTGLVIGGRMVVTNAIAMATAFGVSEKIIGLTIIAFGTSLPELATSVVAAIKKKSDIAVGNVIGSNIFNIFFILGASALVRPLVYDPGFNFDLLLLAGGTAFLFGAMFMGGKQKLDRWEAALLLGIYIWYTLDLIG